MAKKAATKKGLTKSAKPVKKPATKKAEKAPESATPTELEIANQKIADLQKEVDTLKGAKPAEVEKPAKPPGCSLSFPRK